ncbi:MAG: hypothetical protein ACT6QM_06070 [Brevundimonas mediterranea]|uniref:hypothetical protein n=1 Tax=Brevundimonas mediterranea TaxID=74329 RepID=UPI0040331A3A
MSERVLINANLFKVSAPGYNASTATPRDLVLDSTQGQSMSVYQTGTFTAPVTQYVNPPGGGAAQPQFTRVSFADPGYVPFIMTQIAKSGSASIGGGLWWPMSDYDGFGFPISPAPTVEQKTALGARVVMGRGYFEYQNYTTAAQTVRYIIFNLPA